MISIGLFRHPAAQIGRVQRLQQAALAATNKQSILSMGRRLRAAGWVMAFGGWVSGKVSASPAGTP